MCPPFLKLNYENEIYENLNIKIFSQLTNFQNHKTQIVKKQTLNSFFF